ncbi:MAG: DUF2520 domain-containing protein [Alphaproteobacteria bacterium]|nr:DUF2520 domain-containing protein [Alphaproteobacteria bacterium]
MQHLIIGAGRVGRSIGAYARSLGCDVGFATRNDMSNRLEEVRAKAARADAIAIATPDDAIAKALDLIGKPARSKMLVHFAGGRLVEGVACLHPLYSFPPEPLEAATLARIPFAIDPGGPRMSDFIPGAPNSCFVVAQKDRAAYHAIAVLTANFAAHIWNESAAVFAARFPDAPEDALALLLEGCVERFREAPTRSMTGPVARSDRVTVAANLRALADAPRLEALYRAFLASAWPAALIDESDEADGSA